MKVGIEKRIHLLLLRGFVLLKVRSQIAAVRLAEEVDGLLVHLECVQKFNFDGRVVIRKCHKGSFRKWALCWESEVERHPIQVRVPNRHEDRLQRVAEREKL